MNNEPKKPIMSESERQAYNRGYSAGFIKARRLEGRLLKLKLLIRETWGILCKIKDKEEKPEE